MKTFLLILVVCGLAAGCSSTQVNEQTKEQLKEQPRVAAQKPRITETFPVTTAQPASQPTAPPKVASESLNDPNSPLSKRAIYYDFDNSDIKDEYKPVIQAHARYLGAHPKARVRIEGNCDERGSREYNLALGQRRAEAVKAAINLLGAADGQIETVSWGEEKPKALGSDESAWSENRRSDIVYETTK